MAATIFAVTAAWSAAIAGEPSSEPPSQASLAQQAFRQSFTPTQLTGNDYVGLAGQQPVIDRVARAWQTAKRVYLGDPQDPVKARALATVFERGQRQDQQLRGTTKVGAWDIAVVRLRLLSAGQRWPGESDREHRVRLATVLAVDRTTSKKFWTEVAAAKDREPSEAVKNVCGVITLGPTVLGALTSVLGNSSEGPDQARKIRRACDQAGRRVENTAEDVGKFVDDPLGTLAKGVFGPLLRELQHATAYAGKQVGIAIDKIAAPDLGQRWIRQMLGRAATIAVLIALVAGMLGIVHAALSANLAAVGTVAVRAALAGVVGSAVLTVLNVAVRFVDELTSIVIGSDPGKAGKPFATFADTATAAMAHAKVPSFLALLLLLVLLLGLVVVWWEMWLRAPLLYAVAFFYGPAFSASLFPPARQILSQLNALLAAIVLMPLVVIALLQMAAASLSGQDTITAVLQATGLILLAAASPGILVALFSPSAALAAAAGTAGALAGGRSALRDGGRLAGGAASAALGAAGFARERLAAASGSTPRGRDSGDAGGGAPTGSAGGNGPARGGGGGGSRRLPGLGRPPGPAAGAQQGAGSDTGGRTPAKSTPPVTSAPRSRDGKGAERGGGSAPSAGSGLRDVPQSPGPSGPRDPDAPDPARTGRGASASGLERPGDARGNSPASAAGGSSGGSAPVPGLDSSSTSSSPTAPHDPGRDRQPGAAAGPDSPTPARRPGVAGLPSPDQPPDVPGTGTTRPRRPGRPPRGGGLTPPNP